jgi:hypothetical protein
VLLLKLDQIAKTARSQKGIGGPKRRVTAATFPRCFAERITDHEAKYAAV